MLTTDGPCCKRSKEVQSFCVEKRLSPDSAPLFLFIIASLVLLAMKAIGPVIYVALAKSSSVKAQSEAGEAGESGF